MAERLGTLRARSASGAQSFALEVPARLTWKDPSGVTRFASVVTRDVSDDSVFVECDTRATIPLYRLVHLQVETGAQDHDRLPPVLRHGRVLSAVWDVAPCSPRTGAPGGYRLRVLTEPPAVPAAQVASEPAVGLVAGGG